MLFCKSLFFLNSQLLPLHSSSFTTFFTPQHHRPNSVPKHQNFRPQTLTFTYNFTICPSTHIGFSSRNGVHDDFQSTHLLSEQKNGDFKENEELELHNKPSPIPVSNESSVELGSAVKKPNKEEALAPFLKFFKPKDSGEEETEDGGEVGTPDVGDKGEEEEKKVGVEYYEPKPGDFVVGVVVSGNENKLDVNIGSELLGSMLTKEVLPLYDKEMDYLLCDLDKNREEFLAKGKVGIIKHDSALTKGALPGQPVLNPGTVLFAEVLGRTLSGRPLLSCRRLFRRYSWHRVRQLKQIKEPIEVKFTEWNTGGLVTRIEGLRAFLPKGELMTRVNSFTELKAHVGHKMYVLITRMDEARNDIILSERDAWDILYLHEGTLLDGTVKRFLPYGAEIQISGTGRRALLHMSKISRGKFSSMSNLLVVGEKVKVLVLKTVHNKVYLSIADLESEPGLFILNKEKVFSEAEEMAKKYRERLPTKRVASHKFDPLPANDLPFNNEASMYANWKWFKFERDR